MGDKEVFTVSLQSLYHKSHSIIYGTLHDPNLFPLENISTLRQAHSCKNEQFPFRPSDAILTGVTLIYFASMNFLYRFYFFLPPLILPEASSLQTLGAVIS